MKIERNFYGNEDQFFHGTQREIPGDHVLPSAVHGIENYDYNHFHDGEQRRQSVFVTQGDEDRAWRWSSTAAGGRSRVHVVEPEGALTPDPAGGDSAYMTPSAVIKDTHWIPPANESDGPIQGTLPPHNWAEHVESDSYMVRQHANWMPHETRVAMDNARKRDDAAGGPAARVEEIRSEQRTKGNLARHPKLFSTDQFDQRGWPQ